MNLPFYKDRLGSLLSDYRHAQRSVNEEIETLEEARIRVSNTVVAQQLVQEIAEKTQQCAHQRIASVVSRCLEAVFGEEAYELRIDFERKRGKTEARLLFCRGEMAVNPTEAAGGGVVDVAAFALRLACLVLSQPRRRRFLALDEPFKHLSREYRPRVKALLETLSKEMGVQILMVTHSQELVTGKVVEL